MKIFKDAHQLIHGRDAFGVRVYGFIVSLLECIAQDQFMDGLVFLPICCLDMWDNFKSKVYRPVRSRHTKSCLADSICPLPSLTDSAVGGTRVGKVPQTSHIFALRNTSGLTCIVWKAGIISGYSSNYTCRFILAFPRH